MNGNREDRMNKINAYKEILGVLGKHKELLKDDYKIDIASEVNNRIRLQEISEEFGISMKNDCNPNWCKLSGYESIGMSGSEHNRTISWADNGLQPENERLYMISFPTGPYVFGDSYPENTFRSFFDELKGYGAKHVDTKNSNLYFTSEKASCVHDNFKAIFDKYRKLVGNENKEKRIKSLEEELIKLKED